MRVTATGLGPLQNGFVGIFLTDLRLEPFRAGVGAGPTNTQSNSHDIQLRRLIALSYLLATWTSPTLANTRTTAEHKQPQTGRGKEMSR